MGATIRRAPRWPLLVLVCIVLGACGDLKKPVPEPFYAESAPPPVQEFRWSNGKMPKTLDPAKASAPPETDIVRAVYEGLTEVDPATLRETSGIAEKWSASEDLKTWTFYLRKDAKWSNGEPVTAHDFVRSWQRLVRLDDQAAHRDLLDNIVGHPVAAAPAAQPDFLTESLNRAQQVLPETPSSNSSTNRPPIASPTPAATPVREAALLSGVTAVSDKILKVELVLPDKDLPKLLANPIFRPVFDGGAEFDNAPLNPNAVTNGAFEIASVGPEGITLARSDSYWNRDSVKLERVVFVPKENAEHALEAYRAGELDAVTNAEFAPLALKLLEPFEDFRRTTHSALNFYEVNHRVAPFSDRRVREALAVAIERERLTEGDLDGAVQPAHRFLPFARVSGPGISQDKEKARDLLEEAGFPEGENFPVIRLVVNRNDTQQRVAKSVARMWKQNLNLETEIIVKEAVELAETRRTGDFDLLRRNAVFPTADETAGFLSIFGSNEMIQAVENEVNVISPDAARTPPAETSPLGEPTPEISVSDSEMGKALGLILSEDEALYELHAIPLYFPTSYSLVKPYVSGFEMNSLDAPLLHGVSINKNWQPKKAVAES